MRQHPRRRDDLLHHPARFGGAAALDAARPHSATRTARGNAGRANTSRRAYLILLYTALCLGTACISFQRPPFLTPISQREWGPTLEEVHFAAKDGRFDAADSILARFAARYAGTPEALETAYWRALFKLDPLERPESVTPAMALLDGYLSDSRPRKHVAEAVSLRRMAMQFEALNTRATSMVATIPRDDREPISNVRPPTEQRPPIDQAAADAEIKRLKDELAKANAELDRVRRRLMRPPSANPK